jgi:uncharacterized membrane protein YbhN (UPF0104 family)
MRRFTTLKKIISVLIVVFFLFWVVWYVWNHQAEFLVITRVSLAHLVGLYLIYVILLVCNGLLLKVALEAFGIQIDRVSWLALSAASTFANQFLPARGGLGMRALYLSKMYQVRFVDFVAVIGVTYLMHIVINGIVAIGGIGIAWGQGEVLPGSLFGFFLAITVVGLVIQVFSYCLPIKSQPVLLRWLYQVCLSWQRLRLVRGITIKLWGLTIALTAATIFQSKLAFSATSLELSWSGLLVYTASKNLAALVGLTPGGLGIVESISIYLGQILNYATSSALIVQGLIRSVAYTALLLIGPLGVLVLRRRLDDSNEPRKREQSSTARDKDDAVGPNLNVAQERQAEPMGPS